MSIRNLLIFCLLFACRKPGIDDPSYIAGKGSKVLVCCEGNFGWGNADFDIYSNINQTINKAVYKTQNGSKLGDVLQSATLWNGEIYLVLNNSGKIVVIDTVEFKKQREVKGFNSPRYLHAINATKALVTDLYANKVWLIDRTSGIEKSFNVRGHCEQMTESNTEIAIACSKGVIYFFNKSTQQLTDSLETGMDTRQILSYNNTFYTLGSSGTNSAVFEISNHQKSLAWDTTTRKQKFSHFSYNAKTQLWVFLEGKKLVQMNKDFAAPRVQFEKSDANFYNFKVNQTSGEIFISNAKDYVSSGELIHLAKDYSPIKTVSTGIIPGECLILD